MTTFIYKGYLTTHASSGDATNLKATSLHVVVADDVIVCRVAHGRRAVAAAARLVKEYIRMIAPDFAVDVVVDGDLSSLLMVSHGTLYVDGNLRIPTARVQPLIQHEIGTHVVSRHNGGRTGVSSSAYQ